MLAKLSRADMMADVANVSGAPTRRAILSALLKAEPQTIRGLADAAGLTYVNLYHHLRVMERAGLIAIDRKRGRSGSRITLTEAGRLAAKS